MNYGFKKPVPSPTDYRLGGTSLPKVILNPSGNWYSYLPLFEKQYFTLGDSFACTVFGSLNVLETLFNFIEKKEYNFSERYNYNLIGINPPGADPKEAAQSIHSDGVIPQEDLPYIDSVDEFRIPRPMQEKYKQKGREWLTKYRFNYAWVFEDEDNQTKKLALIKEHLKYGPLGVSVTAWEINNRGEYVSKGENNHWVLAFRVDENNCVWIFDSYDSSIKRLSPDHNIQFCMRYQLVVVAENLKQQVSLFQKIVEFLTSLLSLKKKEIEPTPLPIPPIMNEPKPTPEVKPDYLTLMCEAIKSMEGWAEGSRSYRNKNPGNLRGGAWSLSIGHDDKGFNIFRTEADGMKTLRVMITNCASGKSQVYKPTDSLVNFFNKYAPASDNNNPNHYASVVAKKMGVNPFTFTISQIIT
jgi:hypothetical protein